MHRFKSGQLHSGKSKEPVKSRKQALAIALSACGKSKYTEAIQGLGFNEHAAQAFAEMYDFISAKEAAGAAADGPLSDINSHPGKQKGNSGRQKQDPQGMQATFPTVPHAEGRMSPQIAENAIKSIQDRPCEKKEKKPENPQTEVATPTKPTTPTQPTQAISPERQEIKDAAKKKAEQCSKNTGTQSNNAISKPSYKEMHQSIEDKRRKIKELQRQGHPASILIKQVKEHG
jgi:hypothetical protein